MTVTRLKEYIPKNNIKINPNKMIEIMYNIFINFIENQIDEKCIKTIHLLFKDFKANIKNRHFWYIICSEDICCYEFTDRNKDNLAIICGKRINRKYDKNDPNKYLCAEHNRSHRKNNSKSIQIKENEIYCKHIKKDGIHCKYSSKINGYCSKHYKNKYNINIKEVHDKIKRKKYKTYIEDYIENNNIEIDKEFNREIELFSNIDIDSNNIVLEIQIHPTIELLEIVGGNLNNSNNERNGVPNHNINITTNSATNSNDESNIIKIAKNTKNLEILENNFISNYINNTNNKLHELNTKIVENTKIIEKLKKYYKKIEYKKCEANNCNNCKNYNIIYNTYCTEHISHRPLSITNFFHMYTPASIDHHFIQSLQSQQPS